MHHLLLTFCLIAIILAVLTRRYPIEKAYCLLAAFPTLIFITGITDEYLRGIGQINHQILHVAYDSSYLLSLLGIILLLRAVLKRKAKFPIVAATCIAGIPLAHILITHS